LNGVGSDFFTSWRKPRKLKEPSIKLWTLLICVLEGLKLFKVLHEQNRMLNSLRFSKKAATPSKTSPHQVFAVCSYREKLIKNPSPVPAGRIKDIDYSEEEVEPQPGASRNRDKPSCFEALPQIEQAPAIQTTNFFASPNNNLGLRRTSNH
jgi:hypothetical protein